MKDFFQGQQSPIASQAGPHAYFLKIGADPSLQVHVLSGGENGEFLHDLQNLVKLFASTEITESPTMKIAKRR